MIDHISFSVKNFEQSLNFYDKTLAIIGYERLMTFDTEDHQVAGYGKEGKPDRSSSSLSWFKSEEAMRNEHYDFRITDVARAISVAPLLYEPVTISNLPQSWQGTFVDASLECSNPALKAYGEIVKMYPEEKLDQHPERISIVSLGTGSTQPLKKNRDSASKPLATPSFMKHLKQGNSYETNSQVKNILGGNYLRFQVPVEDVDFTQTAKESFSILEGAAQTLFPAVTEISDLARRLAENRDRKHQGGF